jgi:hypothetical protein
MTKRFHTSQSDIYDKLIYLLGYTKWQAVIQNDKY